MLEILKWVADLLFLSATMMMFSTRLASKSVWPWILFFTGNLIWMADSIMTKNYPWIVLSAIFMILDGGLIFIRAWKNCIEEW